MTTGSQPHRLPPLVELAGPAGAGKSTLLSALSRQRAAAQGTIWGLPALRLLENGVQLLPTLFGFWRQSRSLLWDESRHIVRLRTLYRALQSGELLQEPIVIFDEGPIFALAWLRGFGHESMRSEAAQEWWRMTLREWAQAIDVVVVLEAPDAMLAHRIRTRPVFHEVKQASDSEIAVWMAHFRAALDWVLAQMALPGGPLVLRMTTDQDSPEGLAERVLVALSQVRHDN